MLAAFGVASGVQSSKVIRYQLNLTPKSKTMLEELRKRVQTLVRKGTREPTKFFKGSSAFFIAE